ERKKTKRVSEQLTDAREAGMIPWEWVVDETRSIERSPSWRDPQQYLEVVGRAYRRDFWAQQPHRVEVWSEKGTVRGVLAPVLDHYGVGFRVLHGFASATTVNEIARETDGRPLVALYTGDWDPSGLYMSEVEPPAPPARYRAGHVLLKPVAFSPGNGGDPRVPRFSARD